MKNGQLILNAVATRNAQKISDKKCVVNLHAKVGPEEQHNLWLDGVAFNGMVEKTNAIMEGQEVTLFGHFTSSKGLAEDARWQVVFVIEKIKGDADADS